LLGKASDAKLLNMQTAYNLICHLA